MMKKKINLLFHASRYHVMNKLHNYNNNRNNNNIQTVGNNNKSTIYITKIHNYK